jgi:hypothetical protein
MVQSSLATKSQSFDFVKSEIEQTIRQAENGLARFQENRESEEDLQNCLDCLNQLRGIFTLVELRGGTLLCEEAVSTCNNVPVGAATDKNILLTTLNKALFVLRRYVEYHHNHRQDHPNLLLPVINELREARNEAVYPESWHFKLDLAQRPDFCKGMKLRPVADYTKNYDIMARRMRLTYQVALLGILHERNDAVTKKLISRAARGFARLCNGKPQCQLWCLVEIVADTMLDRAMMFSKARKRLFMAVEKYARQLVYVGADSANKPIPDDLLTDLVYLLHCSGSANPEVAQVLQAFRLAPAEFSDAILEAHSRKLFGPGSDVLKSLSEAMQDELNQLKDKLDIIERGIEPDLAELGSIAETLEKLANTLVMLDLKRLAATANKEAVKLRQLERETRLPDETELHSLADSVLGIEEVVLQIANRGISNDADMASVNPSDSREESLCLREAVWVVADEARNALTLAKRAITAFIESDYDKLHLANVPTTLHTIWGGLVMVNDPDAAELLERVGDAIQHQLLDNREPPSEQVLEAMADALTSLEYYIGNIGKHEPGNADLLRLAKTSLDEVRL